MSQVRSPRAKFHYSDIRNVGLSPPKSSKYGFFVINLPLKARPTIPAILGVVTEELPTYHYCTP